MLKWDQEMALYGYIKLRQQLMINMEWVANW